MKLLRYLKTFYPRKLNIFFLINLYFFFRNKVTLISGQQTVATPVASTKSQNYQLFARNYHVQPGKAENTDSGVESIGTSLIFNLVNNFTVFSLMSFTDMVNS